MEPLDVTIHLDYAFDVGYEIDLEKGDDREKRRGAIGRVEKLVRAVGRRETDRLGLDL